MSEVFVARYGFECNLCFAPLTFEKLIGTGRGGKQVTQIVPFVTNTVENPIGFSRRTCFGLFRVLEEWGGRGVWGLGF